MSVFKDILNAGKKAGQTFVKEAKLDQHASNGRNAIANQLTKLATKIEAKDGKEKTHSS